MTALLLALTLCGEVVVPPEVPRRQHAECMLALCEQYQASLKVPASFPFWPGAGAALHEAQLIEEVWRQVVYVHDCASGFQDWQDTPGERQALVNQEVQWLRDRLGAAYWRGEWPSPVPLHRLPWVGE